MTSETEELEAFPIQFEDKLEHLHSFADTFLYLHHSSHGRRSRESANADDALNEELGERKSLVLKTAVDLAVERLLKVASHV